MFLLMVLFFFLLCTVCKCVFIEEVESGSITFADWWRKCQSLVLTSWHFLFSIWTASVFEPLCVFFAVAHVKHLKQFFPLLTPLHRTKQKRWTNHDRTRLYLRAHGYVTGSIISLFSLSTSDHPCLPPSCCTLWLAVSFSFCLGMFFYFHSVASWFSSFLTHHYSFSCIPINISSFPQCDYLLLL